VQQGDGVVSRRPHETDPELYWIDTLDGEVLRRKNRIGYVSRANWKTPRLMPDYNPKEVLRIFRNVILIDKVEKGNIVPEKWLAYSLDFDEKREGMEIPDYWYDAGTEKWVRVEVNDD
jgi:hypothetical protein